MTKNLIKRLTAFLIVFSIVFSFTMSISAQEKPITVYLDGEQLTFDVDPILENGRTLVPMRVIFEALGAQVNWDGNTWTAIATKGDTKIVITIDSKQMLKNDQVVELDVPARLIDSRTLVPVRAVSEGMGADVQWDDKLWQVIITTKPDDTAIDKPDEIPDVKEDETVFSFTELSPADKEELLADKPSLRYHFEQKVIPYEFLSAEEYAIDLINEKNSELLEITDLIWEEMLVSHIINLQINSDDQYTTDNAAELTEEAFYEVYSNIIKSEGLSADGLFDTTYDTTPSGKKLLLVTFKEASDLLNCKYIAMVVDGDELRCFTAETTFSDQDYTLYMLCEITLEGRGSYWAIKNQAEFLSGIDDVISSGSTPGALQSRPLGD